MILFVVVALACLLMLALGCLCGGDQSTSSADRTAGGPLLVATIEVWPLLVLALLVSPGLLAAAAAGQRGRASPAALQRFLF